ncbi:MAG: pseudaminic acid biosynthesis-associated methylase [Candidatus Cloacimonetes bacterium]|nr:pseudaminic acid biosynthesis-associated methylase [Candidatus Cloacimonadota bacterium]
MRKKSKQELFWEGNFGDEYISRNEELKLISSNISLFSKILNKTIGIRSVIEFGANIGLNLIAMKNLIPNIEIAGVEINDKAFDGLKEIKNIKAYHSSIQVFNPTERYDLCFTKGVLIHINPDELNYVYDLLYKTSKKYILIAEYYNPSPVDISYRGHKGFLFKRDFAGEILDKYPKLKLVDYGFVYHRDNNFPQDDINWFLFEKD